MNTTSISFSNNSYNNKPSQQVRSDPQRVSNSIQPPSHTATSFSNYQSISPIEHSFLERKEIASMVKKMNNYDKGVYDYVEHASKTEESKFELKNNHFASYAALPFRELFSSYVKQFEAKESNADQLETRITNLFEGISGAEYVAEVGAVLVMTGDIALLVEFKIQEQAERLEQMHVANSQGGFLTSGRFYVMRVHQDDYDILDGRIGRYSTAVSTPSVRYFIL